MTSEALTEHRTKIPSSYLENYLTHQAHFSLSRMVNKYHSGLRVKWLDIQALLHVLSSFVKIMHLQ